MTECLAKLYKSFDEDFDITGNTKKLKSFAWIDRNIRPDFFY